MGCCFSGGKIAIEMDEANNLSEECSIENFLQRLPMLLTAYEMGLMTERDIICQVSLRNSEENFLSSEQLKQVIQLELYELARALVICKYVRLNPEHLQNLQEKGLFVQ